MNRFDCDLGGPVAHLANLGQMFHKTAQAAGSGHGHVRATDAHGMTGMCNACQETGQNQAEASCAPGSRAPAGYWPEHDRVLEPGGALVHWIDMAPNMDWVCRQSMARRCVVLPNCFADPVLRGQLTVDTSHLPPADFLEDLMRLPISHFQPLLEVLRRTPQGASQRALLDYLARYAQLFDTSSPATPAESKPSGSEEQAGRALAWLSRDEAKAQEVKRLLLNSYAAIKRPELAQNIPLIFEPLSSARLWRQRLSQVFGERGFEVEFCDVLSARDCVKRSAVAQRGWSAHLPNSQFVGRWAGTTAYAIEPPEQLLGTAVEEGMTETAGADELLVEAGVLVTIARKLEPRKS